MMTKHIVLSGKKVSLGVIECKDLQTLWEYYGDFELRKYMSYGWMPVYYEDQERWYERIVNERWKRITLGIIEKSSGKVIGTIGVRDINWRSGYGEIGYWISKEYWGRGYATEALSLMLEYCFEYLNLRKVFAKVFEPNIPSRRVLEKNGFRYIGRFRKHKYVAGEGYVDVLLFELLKDEWKKARQATNA